MEPMPEYVIMQIVNEAVDNVMSDEYNFNGDRIIDTNEAEPMIKEAFDRLKLEGKISAQGNWNDSVFFDRFDEADINKSGCLDKSEVRDFIETVFFMLVPH